jgi:hypothetical protein
LVNLRLSDAWNSSSKGTKPGKQDCLSQFGPEQSLRGRYKAAPNANRILRNSEFIDLSIYRQEEVDESDRALVALL